MTDKAHSKLELFFENELFFIINKPAGLACHGPDTDKTLVDRLREDKLPTFLAHRLDKETSGLLLIAKSELVAQEFARQFEARQIEKYYLAICHKKGNKKQGAVKGFIGKGRNGSWRMVEKSEKAVCTQFFSTALTDGLRLFILKPLSGRTHQIRVALKANASPVLGDQRYGGKASDRMYLHAFSLAFTFRDESYSFSEFPNSGEFYKTPELEAALLKLNASKPSELNWPQTKLN